MIVIKIRFHFALEFIIFLLSETFPLPLLSDLLQVSNQVLQFTLIVCDAHFIRISLPSISLKNYFDPFILYLQQVHVKSFVFVFRF